MPNSDMPNDPRIFFAAERTLLAWIRTGVTTIAFGFVVERFALYLSLVAPDRPTHGLSGPLGVSLVLLGSACCAVSAVQFTRYWRGLSPNETPPHYSRIPSLVLAFALSVIGVALAFYLLL